jgi:hypothetical protein
MNLFYKTISLSIDLYINAKLLPFLKEAGHTV